MIGLTISVINYEIDCYAQMQIPTDQDEWVLYPDPMKNPRNDNEYTNVLRCIVCFTSLVSIICNFRRYQLKLKWLEFNYNQSESTAQYDSDDLFHQYNEEMGGNKGLTYG